MATGAHVEALDHTADVGLVVRADAPDVAFAAVAEAMVDIMVNREQVEEAESWQVEVEADGWEDLLVTWLEEVLYRFELEGLVPHSCHVDEISPTHRLATLR
ncbi:MAG: archease, partial [Chloroflexi bacterium]|nr:archease [Chloroflexota bacterium]